MQQQNLLDANRAVPKILERTMSNALMQLKAAGCSFRVIDIVGNETVHDPNFRLSGRASVRKSRIRRRVLRPYGELTSYFKPLIEGMQPGEFMAVECGDFEPEELRRGMCSYMSKYWGVGTYTTTVNELTSCVEVLRVQ